MSPYPHTGSQRGGVFPALTRHAAFVDYEMLCSVECVLRFHGFTSSPFVLSCPCITQGAGLFLCSILVNPSILPEAQGFQYFILSRPTEVTVELLSVWHGPPPRPSTRLFHYNPEMSASHSD